MYQRKEIVISDTGEGTLIDFDKPSHLVKKKGKIIHSSNEINYDKYLYA